MRNRKKISQNKNANNILLVYFDDKGLSEITQNNLLKIMHIYLEKDTESSVPFIGISNLKLDAPK